MLERKFTSFLEHFLMEEPDKILLVNGARQIGKSYLIRYVGQKLFPHFVEINLKEDYEGDRVFADVHTTNDLYMRLSNFYSTPLGDKTDTLVFLDEIQSYPHLMTMLKFLNQESRYRFIASGSQLGVALSETPYYDNKKKGEVDFLVDDHDHLKALPLEIKSGKDYTEHSALTKFLETPDYGIERAIVFSNEREIFKKKGVTYLPIYYSMFLQNEQRDEPVILPELESVPQ